MFSKNWQNHGVFGMGAALAMAVFLLLSSASDVHAQQRFNPNGQFCFADNSGRMNVFVGNRRGFTAHPVARQGRSRYYRRVGRGTYAADSGAVYQFRQNGNRVVWQNTRGRRIQMFRC